MTRRLCDSPVLFSNLYDSVRKQYGKRIDRLVLLHELDRVWLAGVPMNTSTFCLSKAFIWSRTPQGVDYWNKLVNPHGY